MQSGYREKFLFNFFLIDQSNFGPYFIVQKHSGRILKRPISQDLNKVSSEAPICVQLKIYNNKRYVAWKSTNQRRLATYLRRDPYVCVLAHMPNKTDTFHYYQRLKELERPIGNLLLGPYQNTIAPTPYVGQTKTFYRFVSEDHNGDPFWYFVHKNGYLPDPVLTTAPTDRKMDGFLTRVFPQFKNQAGRWTCKTDDRPQRQSTRTHHRLDTELRPNLSKFIQNLKCM